MKGFATEIVWAVLDKLTEFKDLDVKAIIDNPETFNEVEGELIVVVEDLLKEKLNMMKD